MRKIIYICDKCGLEMLPEERKDFNDHFDFCKKCMDKVDEMVTDWVLPLAEEKALIEVPEIATEEEPPKTDAKESFKEIKKECKKVTAKAPAEYVSKEASGKTKIDWNRACALKEAGWTNLAIARELKANVGTINTLISSKCKEYSKGK